LLQAGPDPLPVLDLLLRVFVEARAEAGKGLQLLELR